MREWVRVSKPVNGPVVVTVTLLVENLSVKWSTKAFSNIKQGVEVARNGAHKALDELKEATQ